MTVDVGVGVGVDMTLALTLTFCMLRIIEGVSGEGRVDMDGFGGGDDWSSSARGGGGLIGAFVCYRAFVWAGGEGR